MCVVLIVTNAHLTQKADAMARLWVSTPRSESTA